MSTEYPKIDTVFERGSDHKVLPALRRAEFGLVPVWHLTEKIDGTNVRVTFDAGQVSTGPEPEDAYPTIKFDGRTDNAQMPTKLLHALEELFGIEQLWRVFGEAQERIVLYGEGYGAGIQKGGAYRDDISFRLFDVRVGDKLLDWHNVEDIAQRIGIKTVPVVGWATKAVRSGLAGTGLRFATDLVRSGLKSQVAQEDSGREAVAEGVVARTIPYLYTWKGEPLRWKIKTRDF